VEAMHLLNDPSVSPLHARISEKEGKYTLSDERSTAGTWVNFEPVTSSRLLQHGDRINFGRSAYRFMLSKPPQHPAPRLVPIQKRDPTTRGN
jgi:pSer/pThr/pTyr-binding forkhead associated (FHA) protein